MKIAEELWEANKRHTDGNFKGYTIRKNDFVKSIADYKQSIIGIIDEMIEEKQKQRDISLSRIDVDEIYMIATKNTFAGWQAALTELKQKIEEL